MKKSLIKLLLLCLVGLTVTACVTTIEPVESIGKAQLLSSRAGDKATLRFESEEDVAYQILYASERNGQWRILPGGQHIVGNGNQIELTDQVPLRENRRYRLRVKSIPVK